MRLQHIGRDLPVPVLVKGEHWNPGGSIKDRVALAIVDDAAQRGLLRPGMTLVYRDKSPDSVSWYRPRLEQSLAWNDR